MPRPPHVEKVHELLLDWATWTATHPHGLRLLGAMCSDWTAVRSGTPPRALTPMDLPPGQIGRVDAAVRDPETPQEHVQVIALYYLGEPEQRRRITRWKHAKALEYLAGRLRANS